MRAKPPLRGVHHLGVLRIAPAAGPDRHREGQLLQPERELRAADRALPGRQDPQLPGGSDRAERAGLGGLRLPPPPRHNEKSVLRVDGFRPAAATVP